MLIVFALIKCAVRKGVVFGLPFFLLLISFDDQFQGSAVPRTYSGLREEK
tara:strand:+ start:302 stop:451 length:150 start_codon:yes stop_codon:yes gene_type:complete